ncbi:MAG: hypothetical protein IT294_18260 [Deltaproteobacteria bacterium]|nr:hypothetical protein [Deltaproteobacteria bacterium]
MGDETLHGIELVARREVRVPKRHHERLVAHELLHRSEIDAGHHEAAREGVAEIVPAEALDARFLEGRLEHAAHVVTRVERCLAGRAREDPRALHPTREGTEHTSDDVIHGHPPRLARLRPRHRHDAGREVDVLPAETELLGLAEARVERDQDHALVGVLELREQRRFFLRGQETDPRVVLLEELHLADGILLDAAVGDRDVEDALQEGQRAIDGRGTHLGGAFRDGALDVARLDLPEGLPR